MGNLFVCQIVSCNGCEGMIVGNNTLGRCLRPGLSTHTRTGIRREAGIRFNP